MITNKLTKAERDQIRAGIDMTALATNPLVCRALLSLLDECDWLYGELDGAINTSRGFETRLRQATQAGTPYSVEQDGINALHLRVSDLESRAESIKKIIHTAKLQLAAGDNFDADLTLELALRELK